METVKQLLFSSREKYILDEAVKILRKHLDPDRILLFGSRAKSLETEHSDFNLAVSARIPDIRTERIINEEIAEISGLHHVGVVYLDSVDDAFREIVLATGETIYEK